MACLLTTRPSSQPVNNIGYCYRMSVSAVQNSWINSDVGGGGGSTQMLTALGGFGSENAGTFWPTGEQTYDIGSPILIQAPSGTEYNTIVVQGACIFGLTLQAQTTLTLQVFVQISGLSPPPDAVYGSASVIAPSTSSGPIDGSLPCSVVGTFTLAPQQNASIRLRAVSTVPPSGKSSILVGGAGLSVMTNVTSA